MALCCFGRGEENLGYIMVENDFINSYMSEFSGNTVKVYLYGLYLCSMPLSKDNSLEHLMDSLSLSKEQVIESFNDLQEKGLVTIYSFDPLSIQYHSIKNRMHYKTYDTSKYADFNIQLEECFEGKVISNPNTFIQYYDFMESSNISPEVLLMIIKHCVDQKGKGVSTSYILKVAGSWINDGIRSLSAVEQRIQQRELNSSALKEVAVAIGKTSAITEEDTDLYIKWTNNWGFDHSAILAACKKSIKTLQKLDIILDECFKNTAMSAQEIESYLKNKKKLNDGAMTIIKLLGTWYDNTAPVVETYISPWIQKGYSIDGLSMIAQYCFKNSIKKLEQMDSIVNTLYSQGIITDNQIDNYYSSLQKNDEIIKQLLSILGLTRIVTINDRDSFKCWTNEWGFSVDMIKFIAEKSIGSNFSEISKKLSQLKEKSIYTIEDATSFFASSKITKNAKSFNKNDRKYDKEQAEASLLSSEDILNLEA